jgi:uncharacterized damage-inducible protein DinB
MKEQLLATLENSCQYTLAVAEAMPDNAWQFKPVDTVWNFGELLHHIAYGIYWWEENYVKANKVDWDPPVLKGGKKEVMVYLEKSYASLKSTINNKEATGQVITGFYSTLDHITHHRGQAVLHLRLKGITPPEYMY